MNKTKISEKQNKSVLDGNSICFCFARRKPASLNWWLPNPLPVDACITH